MNILSNEKLIQRNSRIAQVTGLGGLLVLAAGIYFFVTQPDNFTLIWAIVLLGFILSQVGIYFTNRYGKRPRPDEIINTALKGLDGRYSLYHYLTPTSHLLVGPCGVWALLPRHQKGRITYEKNRWRQRGGGFLLAYMKLFGQEGLGRPDLEIEAEVDSMHKFLEKKTPAQPVPPIQTVLIFTDPRVETDAEAAPTPTITPRQLKETIRKTPKDKTLTMDVVNQIRQAIEQDLTHATKMESAKK